MKKYSILFMAIATILFISCSKDDNDYEDGSWGTAEIIVDVTKPPMDIQVAGQAEAQINPINEVYITWGDGNSSKNTYNHTYTTAGSYKIIMRIKNMAYASVYYNYSSIHFKNCQDLKEIKSSIIGIKSDDTLTVPKIVKFENCPNLKNVWLMCQKITNIEFENCPKLENLDCNMHQLSSLKLANFPSLKALNCSDGTLEELDLTNLPSLEELNCTINKLSSIDLKTCPTLKALYCDCNQLTSIDLKTCSSLGALGCSNNMLTTLNIEYCHQLGILYCQFNKLTELDVSNNTQLKYLNCDNNSDLETIWVWEDAPIKHGFYGEYVSGWTTPRYAKFIKK